MVQKCIISEFIVSLLFDDLHLNFSPEVINTVSSSISDIHAFHSQNVQGSTCHVDLSVKPEIPGNHTICIKAEDQGFVKIKRILYIHVNYVCIFFLKFRNFLIFFFFFSKSGDLRCYSIKVVTSTNKTFGKHFRCT